MRAALAFLLCLLLIPALAAPPAPAKLKPGDTVSVRVQNFEEFSGDYPVLSDGSLSGAGFGPIQVGGKTLGDAQRLIGAALRKTLRDPLVSVFLKEQRKDMVFVSGALTPGGGAVPFVPGMDLRQLVASVQLPEDSDQFEAHLFRPGVPPRVVPLAQLLDARNPSAPIVLQPNDVVAILPTPFVRVWVTGAVVQPGRLAAPAGSDVQQAIAQAGGLAPDALKDPELTVRVRRGPEEFVVPARPEPGSPSFRLEPGDTVLVQLAPVMRVTVAGEVKTPGEVRIRPGADVRSAVAQAGGLAEGGTLATVLLVREGETRVLDASRPDAPVGLRPGDLLVVQRNERIVLVLGEARKAGPVPLVDNRSYRLADVVAEAGGLTDRGSLVHIYHGRPGADGKIEVREIRLDRYLKDGNLEDNPEVRPGDVVLVGQPKGINLASVGQVLSTLILLDNLARR